MVPKKEVDEKVDISPPPTSPKKKDCTKEVCEFEG